MPKVPINNANDSIGIYNFIELVSKYPETKFSTIVMSESIVKFNEASKNSDIKASIWLDINNGNNRTGISPNNEATLLYKDIYQSSNLIVEGLHVYDGHIRDSDINIRKENCDLQFEKVLKLKEEINLGIEVKKIVAGGTLHSLYIQEEIILKLVRNFAAMG